jgi:LysR family transcriptional regulator, transcriptional activator of nhaA
MNRLNYHHLLYFWTVAKEGSIAAACEVLHLTQPTISGQLRALEQSLGHRLFTKQGRGLALTEMGRTVFSYADEIFTIGTELSDVLRGRPPAALGTVRVGVSDVLAKLMVYRMLSPAFAMRDPVRVSCFEGKLPDLLARLAVHDLDVVLGDAPVTPASGFRAFSHRLGESSMGAFAAPALARRLRPGFPSSLEAAPLLVPTSNTLARRSLDHWLASRGLRPDIAGEFEDSALVKVFGQSGRGVFFAPLVIEREVRRQYNVQLVGRIPELREQFYAVTVERRIRHPAVEHITSTARERLAPGGGPGRGG